MRAPPAETQAAILRDYAMGEKQAVVALVHGVSRSYVYELAKQAGLGIRRRGRPHPNQKREAIVRDYLAGEKREVITLMHGVSSSYITTLTRAAGVPMRRAQ